MERTYKIILDNLTIGMQVERDVISKDGAIIVKKGALVEDQRKRDRMHRILFENAIFYLQVSLPATISEEVIQQFQEMEADLDQEETPKTTEEVAAFFKTENKEEIAFFMTSCRKCKRAATMPHAHYSWTVPMQRRKMAFIN